MAGSSSGRWWKQPPKTAKQRYEERRERRRRQFGDSTLPITVEQIVDHENLIEVYKKARQGGQAAGIDKVTYEALSNSEVGDILRELSRAVLDGIYRPQPTRPVLIPKASGEGLRKLNLGVLCDRVVAKAVDLRMKPLWEGRFLPCSYGFREGSGTWKMLAALEAQMVKQHRWVLAVDDLKSAFDNVPIDEVINCHRMMLGSLRLPDNKKQQAQTKEQQKRLLRLIETVVRGSDPTRKRGIDQGNPYSPTCLNALLHDWLDEPLTDTGRSPLWFRYADNLVYLAQSVSEGRQFLRKVRRLLKPLGLTLKGEGGVQNLAKGKEVQLLGFTLRHRRNKVVYGLGKEALSHLAQELSKAHATPHPPVTARLSLLGWVESVGPAFESGDAKVQNLLRLAAENGFRELASPGELRRYWEGGWRHRAIASKSQPIIRGSA